MEEGRSSEKRKAREGESTNSAQQARKKKRKKKKKQRSNEEEEQSKPSDATAGSSLRRDQATLKLKRDKKKHKICGEEGEEQVCKAKKKANTAAHLPYYLKEHSQGQEDDPHPAHANHDADAVFYWKKQERKKVRFSDQFTTCKCPNQSQEDRGGFHGVVEESLENGCAEEASPTACNTEKSKEEPAQDELANSCAGRVKNAIDGKSLSDRKRHKDEVDEVWGKRYTPEEDELLKNAVFEYLKVKGWTEKEGIDKILNCKRHKDAHNCWGVIRLCLPHRPRRGVRLRAFYLLEDGTHLGRWSKEEEELLKRLHKEHGSQWKYLSTMMGRSQYSICTKWRSLKRPSPTGVWAWDEMQQLSDLVHKDLWLKAVTGMQNETSSHKILRDNIKWDEIADAIGTHSHTSCFNKWYGNLSSPMVIDGLWATADDCLLLRSLLESGACTEEEVDWHKLLRHRSGQTCLVRWKQMTKYLGENRTRVFLDKLDSLVRRYARPAFL